MRFGGHETFPVRNGWLYKGLRLLRDSPEKLLGETAADELGVGNNMAKSIRHWLLATGLAQQSPKPAPGSRYRELQVTKLANLVSEQDPFFLEPASWWALHLNLISAPTHAFGWVWFFNHFTLDRFERPVCLEALRRHLQLVEKRLPAPKTLERDLACLLASYARNVPPRRSDPEDVEECPLVELGLLTHFRSSGWYEIDRGLKNVPPEMLGYALNRAFGGATTRDDLIQISLLDALRVPFGPGRAFALNAEALFELAGQAEREPSTQIRISGLAGERTILCPRKAPVDWLADYYRRAGRRRQNAA